ncbi:hypothetical protein V6N13_034021 [Hibiscus sabdariffa]
MVSPLYHGRGCVVVSGSEITHGHWLALMQGVWCRWLINFQREPTSKLHHKFQHFLCAEHSAMPISISRVNQLDAARLDIEMSAMLKEQLVKVFSLIKPGMLFQYEPELDAFLELLIWRFSIWVDKPTLEIALMNLRYQDEHAMEIRGKDKDWTSFSYCSTSNFGFH